jgi:hypothetical protein
LNLFRSYLLFVLWFESIECFGLSYFSVTMLIDLFGSSFLGFTLSSIYVMLVLELLFAIHNLSHYSHDDDCMLLCIQNQLIQERLVPTFFRNLFYSNHKDNNNKCYLYCITCSFICYKRKLKQSKIYSIKFLIIC